MVKFFKLRLIYGEFLYYKNCDFILNKKKSRSTPKKSLLVEVQSSSDNEVPLWSFNRADNDGMFRFSHDDAEACKLILGKLLSLSKMKWSVLKKATHDNGKSKNHILDYDGISPEGKERIKKLCLAQEEIDAIFSFAFDNTARMIGVRCDRVFHIIWYDKEHSFYPVKKRGSLYLTSKIPLLKL